MEGSSSKPETDLAQANNVDDDMKRMFVIKTFCDMNGRWPTQDELLYEKQHGSWPQTVATIDAELNNTYWDEWVVDFQYYSTDADHVYPKEISVLHLNSDEPAQSFFAKSPDNVDRSDEKVDSTLKYQFKLHKTPWKYGKIEWKPKLLSLVGQNAKIYVKGAAKQKFLLENGFCTVNMDDNDCPALKDLYKTYKCDVEKCYFHKENFGLCSFTNVYMLRKWLKCDTYN
jgi:hypothetical protein